MQRRDVRVPVVVCAAGFFAGFGLVGCSSDPNRGYSWKSTFDDGVGSVSVPIFKNSTFATGLETQLTDAVVKEIQRTTPWVVTVGRSADTTLRGTITGVEFERLSGAQGTALVLEQVVRIEIAFDWVDNRTGEARVQRERFAASAIFTPAGQTRERSDLAERDAIGELARSIVRELRSNW